MKLIENAALRRMRAGDTALGMQLRLARSGEIAGLARVTGHDWIMMDMQHSGIDVATIVQISLACFGFDITPVVRISGIDSPDTVRLLDAGVMGIILPDTRNAGQARALVEKCKFTPLGGRSVTTGYVTLGYEPLPIDIAARTLNDQTMVVCMIESLEGLENLDEIAAVEGVDVIHMGCNDLLMDMGLPGQFGCPQIQAALDRLLAVCAQHGKFAGSGGDRDVERQRAFIAAGGRFVTTDNDMGFLRLEATRKVERLRQG